MSTNSEIFYPISEYYKKRFGQKVYKIPVSIVDTCPNREGLKKMETCIFCDEWGSAAYEDSFEKTLKQQIEDVYQKLSVRYKAEKFFIYFQAYTNSFTGINKLRAYFDLALSYPFVEGIIVGTRPDCLSPALFKLWNEYSEKTYFSVELGVQSFFEKHVAWLKRGHHANKSIDAIFKIKTNCPKVDLGIHFILGLPNETDEEIIEYAKITNSLPVDNVKLHNLHVLKNTGLEILYHRGEFQPLELEEYAHKCRIFLEHLRDDIPVHRLSALASRWDELIAPEWTKFKMVGYQGVISHLKEKESYQGKNYIEYKDYAIRSFPTHLHGS